MSTLVVTVDLECCRCSGKIQKILCCIQDRGEFVIDKIVYEKDKVIVSGPFDADKLSCRLCCKAGRIIKNIEVVKPPPPKPEPKPEPVVPYKLIPYPYPYPYQQPAWPCSCPTSYCQCHSKPPPPEPPKPPACHCPSWPSCYCSGYPPPSYVPPPMPPYPFVVCDENPAYGACAVM
uniref:HMA domain-containing protein n=1 Tax=Arundo donax TaxID=35708 RepID=A0A0A8YW37_ARUDO